MQRIANGTQISALPAPAAAVGTPGYGTNGDPAGGVPATIFGADEYNAIQEELIAIILAAGLTPSRTNNAQVLAAIRSLSPNQMQVFNASGNFTVPAGVTRLKARGWGGGGGGGGSTGANSCGTGAAGGGYFEGYFAVTPGQVIPITIGNSGSRGSNTGGSGGPGGSTSFGALATAYGGSGGVGAAAGIIATPGPTASGAVGSAGNAVFTDVSQGGGTGFQTGGGGFNSGGGGGTTGYSGSGFSNSSGSVAQPGNDGVNPGVGGGGGVAGGNGGLGGPGRIIVEW